MTVIPLSVHLDFETFSVIDLKTRGLTNYLSSSTFEVLLTAIAIEDLPIMQWQGCPLELLKQLSLAGTTFHAFNATFERRVLERLGLPIPLMQWHCTMAHAYCRGFSGTLNEVGEQVGLPLEMRKFKDGTRLINKFCTPRTITPRNPNPRWTPEDAPQDWERFCEYNRQDVVAEREIARYLSQWPLTGSEREDWFLDQRINDRGVPVDLGFAKKAIRLSKHWSAKYNDLIKQLTGGISGSQTGALLEWCVAHGYPENNLQAKTIDKFLTAFGD